MLTFLIALLAGAAAAWGLSSLDLIPWRRAANAHWTERARLLMRARVSRQLNLTILGMGAGLSAVFLGHRPWWPALTGAMLGALAGGFPIDCEIDAAITLRTWLHAVVATVVLAFLRLSTVALAAVLMPSRLNLRAAVIIVAFLAVQVAFEVGLGVRLLQWMRLLRRAGPRLQAIVAESSAQLGVSVRAAWELQLPNANAVAFVATREVAFTPRLLAIASDDELRAVCAHELGHISETRWTRFGRVAGSLMFFPLIFVQPAVDRFGSGAMLALLAAMFVIIVLRSRLGRRMETRADRIATENTQEKAVYARVLEKIYRVNQIPAVMSGRLRPHPNLYDRMLAAGVTPDYPRPKPPPRMRWSSLGLLLAIVGLCVAIVTRS